MTELCGCCEGIEALTPLSTANRPGLDNLSYRVGTHAIFLKTMKARLSSSKFPALKELKTRDSSDPTIALLDAWALVADVLTFYQERIANEGYLRTATERRSVLELGRLVGYTLRPGVSATVYPAFMMETGYNKGGEVPKGTRIQSIPAPGEMPQYFETSERIEAREEWNELKPRLTRPQKISLSPDNNSIDTETLYFQGTSINLKANDPLLVLDSKSNQQIVRHVKLVEADNTANRTKVTLQEPPTSDRAAESRLSVTSSSGSTILKEGDNDNSEIKEPCAFEKLEELVEPLIRKPSLQPPNRQQLDRSREQTFKCQSDMPSRLLSALQPRLSDTLYKAWANLPVTISTQVEVHAFRTKASPFGHNAPLRPVRFDDARKMVVYDEWSIDNPLNQQLPPNVSFTANPISGQPPLAVQFTNQSTGDITGYNWSFGDNSTSTSFSPSHTFNTAATYTVILTAFGSNDTSTEYRIQIIVTDPPIN
jgi:PKD domain